MLIEVVPGSGVMYDTNAETAKKLNKFLKKHKYGKFNLELEENGIFCAVTIRDVFTGDKLELVDYDKV